jgi:hypothetical protein
MIKHIPCFCIQQKFSHRDIELIDDIIRQTDVKQSYHSQNNKTNFKLQLMK